MGAPHPGGYGMGKSLMWDVAPHHDLHISFQHPAPDFELAIAHYGSRKAVFKANHSCLLQDEIKICGIREDEEAIWEE